MNSSLASSFGLPEPLMPNTTGATVQRVYDDLRRRIISLQLPPDTTLSRAELTETYEVSQTPLREAMQLLKQEGLVRIYPQSKTVVTRIDVPQIHEAHFLRVALETEVVRRLASMDNASLVTRARSIIRMQEAVADDPEQLAVFQELDELFHQTLFAGVSRSGLHMLVRERSGHLDRIRRLHLPEKGKAAGTIAGHVAIIDALADRSPQGAVDAMRDHLSRTISKVEDLRQIHPGYFA
ncbi:GntR family transcriptional regulator [Paracoccus laeviglucosivorans]|uniref:Transcriptional regulator, GntR family n=1 Tax=Paracoccus laeviglucosivorans TaxID=1197861 RepID=A0A521EHR4_9RHOB|nr:GntR family transcriptional regulator [Paracoccus laeviglucosivorans]SMO83464.1 transcriptional regulator, GntR family [Paracoccus laeviglucosivorans]